MMFHRMIWCSATSCAVWRETIDPFHWRIWFVLRVTAERLCTLILLSLLSTFKPAHTLELRMERCGSTLITQYPALKVTFLHLYCCTYSSPFPSSYVSCSSLYSCSCSSLISFNCVHTQYIQNCTSKSFWFPLTLWHLTNWYAGALDRHCPIHKTRQRREERCRIRGWQY